MTTYAETAEEIMAVKPGSDRHRELVRRSDALLERLESLNLGHYGALKTYNDLEDCRLTSTLVQTVDDLLVEVGLDPRRLSTTRQAMDAVFDCQDVLFHGHLNDADDEEDS